MKTKNKQPLVSVIIPAYNAEAFLGYALESILTQTYKNLEVIIVNDGSKDKTLSIAKTFAKKDKRVRVINLFQNKGESTAANIAFANSLGEFIARMDADDVAYPERIEKQVLYMLRHPKTIVVGSQADVINEQGDVVGKKTFPCTHKAIYRSYGMYHPMLHPSCMFRKSLLPNPKVLYSTCYAPNDDYYTLFGLLEKGEFVNLPDTLVAYRIHGNNISLNHARSKVFNALRIRKDAIRDFGYRPTLIAILVNILQLFGALILPEKLIVQVYFVFRGMVSLPNPSSVLCSPLKPKPLFRYLFS